MSMTNKELNLESQLRDLDKEIKPTRDLWSGVSLAIEQKAFADNQSVRKSSYTMPLAWAASVVLAVLVTWNWSGKSMEEEVLPASLVAMEKQFTHDRDLLLVSLGQPDLSTMSSEMKAQFAQISSAKKSLRDSLKNDPDNVDLLNLVKWLNQQELDLIEQLYQPRWQTI